MKTAQKPRPEELVHGHQEMLHMLNAKNENLRKVMNRRKCLYQNPTKYHDQTQLTRCENPHQRT